MKIRTVQLKDAVSKAIKGVSNNKLIPVTELLKIEVTDGKLTLETTDAMNYLYVTADVDSKDALYAVVNADLFAKLVARTTTEWIDLDVRKDAPVLLVKGNGTYTIELPLDESGQMIKYPDPLESFLADAEPQESISLDIVSRMLTALKPSLATTYENPCYTGYYYSDSDILATDTYKIARLVRETVSEPVLISPQVVDLLSLMTAEPIEVFYKDGKYVYRTSAVTLYAPELDGIEDFMINEIRAICETDYPQSCKVSRQELLAVIDRLALFVSPFDKNAIELTFTKDALQISSKTSSGVETLPYLSADIPKKFKEFTCLIDIEMLLSEVKAVQGDSVSIQFGDESAIKFIEDDLTVVIALLENE